jgi:hypothetical protein
MNERTPRLAFGADTTPSAALGRKTFAMSMILIKAKLRNCNGLDNSISIVGKCLRRRRLRLHLFHGPQCST